MDELTRRVLAYQCSGEGLQDLLDDIATTAYRFPRRNSRCNEDDCGEFLLFFRARISSLLRRFRYCGTSFEAYLQSNLKWQLRTYLRRREQTTYRYHIAQRPCLWQDTTPSYGFTAHQPSPPFGTAPVAVPHNSAQRRRIIIIALKACLYLSEVDISLVADIAAYDPQWLRECWLRLRVRLNCRRKRHEGLRLRRNRLFVLIHSYHYQVIACTDDQERLRMEQELAVLKNRLTSVRREISRIPHCPTNAEISEVTEVPKGTIDSTLFYAKRRLEVLQEPIEP